LRTRIERDYAQVRHNIGLLYSTHPESPKNAEYQNLLKDIDKLELEQKRKSEAEERERIRLENIGNTGIWEIDYYVDRFGEKTTEGYIKNKDLIIGRFSNTATQNSALNVEFLISSSTDICIQLYEYARNSPVKVASPEYPVYYSVEIKDSEGHKYTLWAANYSDRLQFDEKNSKSVHNVLIKGGQVGFWIQEADRPTSQYQFTIDRADWYDNAYNKLTGK